MSLAARLAVLWGAAPWLGGPAFGAEISPSPPAGIPGGGPDLLASLLKMGAALAAVLGIMILAVYALRRFGGGRFGAVGGGRLIRVLGSQYLGGKNQVSLVEVEGERFLLGVSSERITMLGRMGRTQRTPTFSLEGVSPPEERP
ncbi:MAG: flagellar biosynthetic protein FliO [Nitrospinota bacterium]